MAQTTLEVQGGNNKIMKTIQLCKQHVEYLVWLLKIKEAEPEWAVSATDRAIVKAILSILKD